MDIGSLLNREDRLPTTLVAVSVPTKSTTRGERVGKERVEKSCPSCGRKNHIRTTKCKTCGEQLRGRSRATPKAKLRRPPPASLLPPPPARRRLSVAAILTATELPDQHVPSSTTATAAAKVRAAGDRTTRQCRICLTRNHIRVTLCSKCRRNMRPTS